MEDFGLRNIAQNDSDVTMILFSVVVSTCNLDSPFVPSYRVSTRTITIGQSAGTVVPFPVRNTPLSEAH